MLLNLPLLALTQDYKTFKSGSRILFLKVMFLSNKLDIYSIHQVFAATSIL